MPSNYSLTMPHAVRAGAGCAAEIGERAAALAPKRLLVMTDRGIHASGVVDSVLADVRAGAGAIMLIDDVPPEPECAQVVALFHRVNGFQPQAVLALGGGSVMDAAKLIAAMVTNPDFAANPTDPAAVSTAPCPLIAAPTTAGTGSEATQNAIVLDSEKKRKIGVTHPRFVPGYVFLDPLLTRSVPPAVTASTGIDALCHAVECMISKKSNPFCRMLALEAVPLILSGLETACRNPEDMAARESMLLAAFYGGVCINTSSTVAVHALSYPLGGAFHIPHGVANAMLLQPVLEFNFPAIVEELAAIADRGGLRPGGSQTQKARASVERIAKLLRAVEIPTDLRRYGVRERDLDFLTDSALAVRRLLDQNPRPMRRADVQAIYQTLLIPKEGG